MQHPIEPFMNYIRNIFKTALKMPNVYTQIRCFKTFRQLTPTQESILLALVFHSGILGCMEESLH